MAEIEIEVDGLPVLVDAEEYEADSEYVIRKVREGRRAVQLDVDEVDELPKAPTFNEVMGE
jgi:hypothetical protein